METIPKSSNRLLAKQQFGPTTKIALCLMKIIIDMSAKLIDQLGRRCKFLINERLKVHLGNEKMISKKLFEWLLGNSGDEKQHNLP